MKAAIYTSKGAARQVLEVVERQDPEPVGDEVRVKVAFSGVNPSDVKTRARAGMEFAEVIPHSDGAGIVDAVGPRGAAGSCSTGACGSTTASGSAPTARPPGSSACLPPRWCRCRMPFPSRSARRSAFPLMTAYHAVQACGSLVGKTVLVPGAAGSVGFYAAQLARLAGADVIAVVSSDEKAADRPCGRRLRDDQLPHRRRAGAGAGADRRPGRRLHHRGRRWPATAGTTAACSPSAARR